MQMRQDEDVIPAASERTRHVAKVFDRVAQTYDSVGVPWFTPIAERLVHELAPVPGEQALDVGCGRGAALFPLAAGVGPTGRVVGIDIAPGMIAALRPDIDARGLVNVDVQVMDATSPALGGATFDLLASSLVLFFLPEPRTALDSWHGLLVPGGRLGISTFGPRDPHWAAVDDVFTPYLPQQMLDARTSGTSGPFGSDDGMASLVRSAGFVDVDTVHLDLSVTFEDVAQWNTWSWSHGQRAMWEAVPHDRRADVLSAAAQRLEAARDDTGRFTFWQQVRYTLGRRAAS